MASNMFAKKISQVLVQYNAHPLLAVAWEGTWGFAALSILLVPFGYWHVSEDWAHGPTGLFEDSIDAFVQVILSQSNQ